LNISELIPNFVKQMKQAILLRSIKKQERLLVSELKFKLYESNTLDGSSNVPPYSPLDVAPRVLDEKDIHKHDNGSEPSKRECVWREDGPANKMKFKLKN